MWLPRRRISATSVAQRVAAERGEALGETVGYQIRMEAKRSAATRLLFWCGVGSDALRDSYRCHAAPAVAVAGPGSCGALMLHLVR